MRVGLLTCLFLPALALVAAGCEKAAPPAAPPPPDVYVTPVVKRDVPVYLDLVGQTLGFQDVELRARVEGFLESMTFREGSFVKRGDVLYEIDPQSLVAQRAQAQADQVAAEARLAKATNDVNRYTPLVAKQAVSKRELDDAVAEQDAARAQVAAAKAVVERATLDLGYAKVTAPISGLIGTTLVKPGNLVGRGQNTLLTTISQIDPILFRAGATEADYMRVVRRAPDRVGAEPRLANIELTLSDGTKYDHTGKISLIDRAVDPTTGTLGVQIEFPNPELILRPGQYGRARILIEQKPGAMLVPQRAVQEMQNLYSVAVVGADNKIAFKNVTVGPRVDSLWVIESGVAVGDRVVVEGLQRVREGLVVTAKPAPPAGAEPKAPEAKSSEAKH
jgi:membrane fusion protein (multidrug efflux system)